MRFLFALIVILTVVVPARGQQPLYIVNGEVRQTTADIPPEVIERIEELPADEFTIERYGQEAAHGVVLVTLKYDVAARLTGEEPSLTDYLTQHVVWTSTDPAARVVLRYRITTDGELVVSDTLEATDRRLLRRVLKALEEAPRWEPATKQGTPVESEGVVRLELPIGKRIPRQIELVIR